MVSQLAFRLRRQASISPLPPAADPWGSSVKRTISIGRFRRFPEAGWRPQTGITYGLIFDLGDQEMGRRGGQFRRLDPGAEGTLQVEPHIVSRVVGTERLGEGLPANLKQEESVVERPRA
jgi:hypothetical protein